MLVLKGLKTGEGRNPPINGVRYHACAVNYDGSKYAICIGHAESVDNFVADVTSNDIDADEARQLLVDYRIETTKRLLQHHYIAQVDDEEGEPAILAIEGVVALLRLNMAKN
jgi:hypothetical protein